MTPPHVGRDNARYFCAKSTGYMFVLAPQPFPFLVNNRRWNCDANKATFATMNVAKRLCGKLRPVVSTSKTDLDSIVYGKNHASSLAELCGSVGCTDEQKEFRRVASEFATEEFLPFAASWAVEEHFPVDTMRKAARLGFAGIYVSSDVGGSELGCADAAVIFESLGYGDVSTTAYLTVHNMVSYIIDRFGTENQRESLLPSLTTMERLCSYCLTEPGSGSDAASLKTTARKQAGDFVLNGSKAFISGGGVSDVYLVIARTGEEGPRGLSAFLVEKGTKGLSFGKEEDKMGWRSQPTTTVTLDNVKIPERNLLGDLGSGFKIAMKALDRGRVNVAATSVGGGQFCVDHASEYANSRKQFGRSIASFQNTQFRLADMATQIQASRLMVRHAAQSLDEKSPSATMDAAMAKRFATDSGFEVSNAAMQILGGYGYLRDYPIERYFRDLRVMSILEGTNEIMRLVINREMTKHQ